MSAPSEAAVRVGWLHRRRTADGGPNVTSERSGQVDPQDFLRSRGTGDERGFACYVPPMNRGVIGTIVGVLVVIILVLVIMRMT